MRCSDRRQPITVVIGASLAAGAGSSGPSVQSFEQKETKRTKGVCNFVSFVSFCRIAGVLFSHSPGFLFVCSEFWAGTFPGAWIGWPSRVQAGESVEFPENVTLSPMVTTRLRVSSPQCSTVPRSVRPLIESECGGFQRGGLSI